MAACNLPEDLLDTSRHHVDDGDILEALFVLEPATVERYLCQFRLTMRYHHHTVMHVERFDVNHGNGPCMKSDVAELEYQEKHCTVRYDPCLHEPIKAYVTTMPPSAWKHSLGDRHITMNISVNANRRKILHKTVISLRFRFSIPLWDYEERRTVMGYVQNSSLQGHVTNLFFTGKRPFSFDVSDTYMFTVSSQIMIVSFPYLEIPCSDGNIMFYSAQPNHKLSSTVIQPLTVSPAHPLSEDVTFLYDQVLCNKRYHPPIIFNSTTGLKLSISGNPKAVGFILQYSFHNVSQAPVRLGNGLWNCSREHYPSFEHHVRCNMKPECQNAVDETNCPFTSHACGSEMNATRGTSHRVYCEARPKMVGKRNISMVVEQFHVVDEDGKCVQSVLVDFLYTKEGITVSFPPCQRPTVIAMSSKLVEGSAHERGVRIMIAINQHDLNIQRRMHISVRLRFHVSQVKGYRVVNHTQLSPHSGYVTNYLFDGKTLYFRDVRVRFIIQISSQQLVTSFRHFDVPCEDGDFRLHTARVNNKDFEQATTPSGFYVVDGFADDERFVYTSQLCGTLFSPPSIHNVTVGMAFITVGPATGTGFKLLYSIHNVTQAPQILDNGMWNCSAENYPSFAEHVKCNLVTECRDGEDEKACPYTSHACGSGLIDVGGKCYKYFNLQDRLSWYEAQTRCLDLNMGLVNPQTPQEWERFREVLSYGMTSSTFYTGLRTSQGDPAYREIWQWSDHTMAYYHHVHADGHVVKPTCSKFRYIDNDKLLAVGCGSLETDISGLMCEYVKLSATTPQTPRFHLQNGNMYSSSIFFSEKTLVQCPDGHVVKDFLSCDLESKCGVQSYATSCRTTEVGDIPMFTCSVGSQTVHYTLVCDHRRDCADG
ncbi:hypothetical protein BaRGS_00038746, partial [Batillaria attramentaria]